MPEQKETNKKQKHPPVSVPSAPMEKIAAQYLDLWQDNLRHWATDPDALDKWLRETAQHTV